MSTKVIISIVAAIVIVGGGAWYFLSHKSVKKEVEIGTQQKKDDATGTGTFADLVGKAGSWKCTVKTEVEQAPSEGVAYIADGKVRADFTSKVAALQGKTVTSHMITADGYVYTWSDAYPQGMKMKMPEGQQAPDTNPKGSVPMNAPVEYTCAPWVTDPAVFTPPTSVSFMEMDTHTMPHVMPKNMPAKYPI